jgi:hypothetical protein
MQRDLALPLAGMALFAAVAMFGACSTTSEVTPPPVASDAANDTADATTASDTTVEDVYEDLSFDFASDVAWESKPLEAPDAPAAPVVACGADAGDGGACPLPPSKCLDGRWLESYVNGTCVDGTCQWWRIYHDCQAEGGSFCSVDRCQFAVGK